MAGPATRRLHVLLAEDHPVNQKLAVRLLEKRGHSVVVVEDGAAAVAATAREGFDMVLMDIQMPRLSGLEATAAIRERERGTGRRVPILAMTAHAMQGDRERCLDAGMDGYVSKPLTPAVLFGAIDSLVAPLPADVTPARVEDELLERFDGDRDLLVELAGLFLQDSPGRLATLITAARERDSHGLEAAAHLLRGSISIFGAEPAVAAALRLEELGHERRWDGVDEAVAEFRRELDGMEQILGGLVRAAA
jgi:two-component system sensor histidine kinase/response regulator